jgi:hypothetical protein
MWQGIIFFAPAWILFEDRKLHPYLTDRSINDLQIPVKNNTADKGRSPQAETEISKSGTQKLPESRSYRTGVIFGARVNTVHLRI